MQTITTKFNALGYYPKKVAKSQPQKKSHETEAIFAQVNQINQAVDVADDILYRSMDAKATVKVGPFTRGHLPNNLG